VKITPYHPSLASFLNFSFLLPSRERVRVRVISLPERGQGEGVFPYHRENRPIAISPPLVFARRKL